MPFSSKKDAITACWILTITASWILTITASWIQLSQHLDFCDTFNYFTIYKCSVPVQDHSTRDSARLSANPVRVDLCECFEHICGAAFARGCEGVRVGAWVRARVRACCAEEIGL